MGKVTIGPREQSTTGMSIPVIQTIPTASVETKLPSISLTSEEIQQLLEKHKDSFKKLIEENKPLVMPLDPIDKRLQYLEDLIKNLPPTRHTKIVDEYDDKEIKEQIRIINDMKIPTLMARNSEMNIKYDELKENYGLLIKKNKELTDKVDFLENIPVSEYRVIEVKQASRKTVWIAMGCLFVMSVLGIVF